MATSFPGRQRRRVIMGGAAALAGLAGSGVRAQATSAGPAPAATATHAPLLPTSATSPGAPATERTGAPPADASAPPAIDIEPIVQAALRAVERARLGPGVYSRFLGAQRERRPNGAAPNPYGSAAAACILYACGRFPRDLAERAAFVSTLQAGQSAATGLFSEPSHNSTHASAYVLAALELFDAGPRHPVTGLRHLLAPGAIEQLLDGLDWTKPWGASHHGAGSFAALYLAGDATPAWQERYFQWLWNEQDPHTGLWRKGWQRANAASAGAAQGAPLFDALAASFHYLFNHQIARRPLRYPQAMIDSALRVRAENLHPALGKGPGFAEIDWMYCLTRPLAQCGHRFADVQAELRAFARQYTGHLGALVQRDAEPFQDLHALNGTIAALAELQQAVPGLLRSERPLRLTLDRRPFI